MPGNLENIVNNVQSIIILYIMETDSYIYASTKIMHLPAVRGPGTVHMQYHCSTSLRALTLVDWAVLVLTQAHTANTQLMTA